MYASSVEPALFALAAFGGIVCLATGCNSYLLLFAVNLARFEYGVADLTIVVLLDLPTVNGHHEVPVLVAAKEHMHCVAVRLNAVNHSRTSRNTCRLLSMHAEDERHTGKKYKCYSFHYVEMFVVFTMLVSPICSRLTLDLPLTKV